jgi:hypothetical protein
MKLKRVLAAPLIAAATLTASITVFADTASHRQQVDILFRLTQMQKKIEESVESVLQLQMRQNPKLALHEAELRRFFNRHMGWTALREEISVMYMNTFTEEELVKINDFYITPAGQKVIEELPNLVSQRNALAMQRLQQNIGELQKIIGSPHP